MLVRSILPCGVAAFCAAYLPSRSALAEPLDVSVVSYNVYLVPITAPARAERLELLPAKILALGPDVVLLQEVWSEADSAELERALRAGGLDHVRRAASSAPFAYGSSGLLIASRFPILESQRLEFELGRRPHTPYHLDWIGKKGLLEVELETPLGALTVASTHLQASYRTGSYEAVRIAQSLELASWLKDSTHPLVLGGDFNADANAPSTRLLRERAGLTLPEHRWRVDHVLIRDGAELSVRCLEVRRVLQERVQLSDGSQRRLSDHRAVFARLRLEQRTRPPSAQPSGALDPGLVAEAARVLGQDETRTWRQSLLGLVALGASGVAAIYAARRRRRSTLRRRRWTSALFATALVGVWMAYFVFVYAPHRRAGIEHARAHLVAP